MRVLGEMLEHSLGGREGDIFGLVCHRFQKSMLQFWKFRKHPQISYVLSRVLFMQWNSFYNPYTRFWGSISLREII